LDFFGFGYSQKANRHGRMGVLGALVSFFAFEAVKPLCRCAPHGHDQKRKKGKKTIEPGGFGQKFVLI